MLSSSFSLVKASQTSIMSLVESPALLDRKVSLTNLSEHSLESGLSPLEDTGVTNIKAVALILQGLAGSHSLSTSKCNLLIIVKPFLSPPSFQPH